jgi:hypothetical protein
MPSLLDSLVFEAIMGNLLSSMLFMLFLSISYLVIEMLSMGEMFASMRRVGYGVFPLIFRLFNL